MIGRRQFLKWAAAASGAAIPARAFSTLSHTDSQSLAAVPSQPPLPKNQSEEAAKSAHSPRRIPNEYSLFLSGEEGALAHPPSVAVFQSDNVLASVSAKSGARRRMCVNDELAGWRLVALLPWLNGIPTAVFEKHVTHRGVIVYITESGELERIPKGIGDLASIHPRPINADPGKEFIRYAAFPAQPDAPGDYILNSNEDPCYENVAALGAEFIGWTLVANEEAGPEKSLWLEADGKSRQVASDPQSPWAPDLTGRLFDPARFLPSEYLYDYVPGYSKRTLLGGYLPVADIGVWNPNFKVGYEVMVLLPPGADSKPMGRVRAHRISWSTARSPDASAKRITAHSCWPCTAIFATRWIPEAATHPKTRSCRATIQARGVLTPGLRWSTANSSPRWPCAGCSVSKNMTTPPAQPLSICKKRRRSIGSPLANASSWKIVPRGLAL